MSEERQYRSKAEVEAFYQPVKEEPLRPVTLRQKWENFWFYHKKAMILGGFLVVLFAVTLWQFLAKERADYTVMLAMDKAVPATVVEALEGYLAGCGEDLNGDGKVIVDVYDISTSTNNDINRSNATKLMAELQNGEIMLFFVDPVYFDKMTDLQVFEQRAEFADCDGYAVNLRDTPLVDALNAEVARFINGDFYLAKRAVAGTDFEKWDKSVRCETEALTLLKNLLAACRK